MRKALTYLTAGALLALALAAATWGALTAHEAMDGSRPC